VGLGRSIHCGDSFSCLCHLWHVHNCVDFGVINALAIDALFGVSTGSRQPRQKD
jgi:hypothetical protein